ncbi:MAG: Rap1a/Tai family immunity protein [Terracidiphilus sp.]
MRRWLLVVFVLMLLCAPSVARAEAEHDGNELSEECNTALRTPDKSKNDAPPDAIHTGMCLGLVRGAMDMMTLWERVDSNHSQSRFHGCIPTEVSLLEAIKVVMKYLNDHPERLHERDSFLIVSALTEAYPCHASSPGAG